MPYNSKQRNDYDEESIENFGLFGSLGNHCGRWLVVVFSDKQRSLSVAVCCCDRFADVEHAEQCADMTMRLRSEYLFSQGRYSEIRKNELRHY